MNIADEIQKLHEMCRNGRLTDDEFAAAKLAVLARNANAGQGSDRDAVEARLRKVELDSDLARIDMEWEQESKCFMFMGGPDIPGPGTSSLIAGGSIAVGTIAAIMTASTGGPSWPIFLLVFGLPGLVISILMYRNWCQYQAAYQAYEERRSSKWREEYHSPGDRSSGQILGRKSERQPSSIQIQAGDGSPGV